ncbi:MAG: LPO_1073/Vpar_1526 family protein [Microcoleaceae cyanobacterium]
MTNKQSQKSGNNSTNYQAEQITVNSGLSYSEVKDIALDVFENNFYQLAGIAQQIALERAEHITEEFIQKLHRENPESFSLAQNPDFQYSLLTVQQEFARSGDQDLGSLLVDLLVDRSKETNRSLLKIVLHESLNIAPKLTWEQLAALSIVFLLKHTQSNNILNFDDFGKYLDKFFQPFVGKLVKNQSCYQHLQYSGCGSINAFSNSLEDIFSSTYQTLFTKGFEPSEITKRNLSIDLGFFMICLNNPTKWQFSVSDIETLKPILNNQGIESNEQMKIIELFNLNKMSTVEMKEKCVKTRSYMKTVFDIWSDSAIQNFQLTSVGIALGHANIKRLVGEFTDLSIWIH